MKTRIHSLREPFFVALETLRAHKMRSFLMLLGMVLSVSTLIMVVSLISGVNLYVADKVANLGSNVFLVLRFPIVTDAKDVVKALRRNKPLSWDDYTYLRDNSKLAVRVGAQAWRLGRAKAGGQRQPAIGLRACLAVALRADLRLIRYPRAANTQSAETGDGGQQNSEQSGESHEHPPTR